MQYQKLMIIFFFSSRRRHTRWPRDWNSDVCSSDLQSPHRRTSMDRQTKFLGRGTTLARQISGLRRSTTDRMQAHRPLLDRPARQRLSVPELLRSVAKCSSDFPRAALAGAAPAPHPLLAAADSHTHRRATKSTTDFYPCLQARKETGRAL